MNCKQKFITQSDLSKKTGIAQPNISVYLEDIKLGMIFRKPILKVLKAQGKQNVIDKFLDDIK